MVRYREHAPPPRLADIVECFWTMDRAGEPAVVHRVVPDGCADILFAAHGGSATLEVVGAMTRFEDFHLPAGQSMAAVRFRPGMWTAQIGVPAASITDRSIALEDLWGARGRRLLGRMGDASSLEERIAVLAASLTAPVNSTPVQRAIAWMERRHGCVSLNEVARQAGLSARQFRRLCAQQIGLSPKLLARVLRFRHALGLVRQEAGDHAGLATDCGYTDQSHFIAEFRQFSGRTPHAFLRAAAA